MILRKVLGLNIPSVVFFFFFFMGEDYINFPQGRLNDSFRTWLERRNRPVIFFPADDDLGRGIFIFLLNHVHSYLSKKTKTEYFSFLFSFQFQGKQ